MNETSIRCSKCGKVCEINAAQASGWLIASDVLHNEPGRMVIRCTEHIDVQALTLSGQDYSRFERREANTPRATVTVAITWRGKVVNAFYDVRGGEIRANDPDFLLGLNEQALRDAGFRKIPRSTGEEALLEIEAAMDWDMN